MYDRDDPSSETEEAGETGEVVDCDAGQENDDANPKCTLEPVQVRVIGRRLAMFMIASDERRRVRYERVDDKPWRVERHVDR